MLFKGSLKSKNRKYEPLFDNNNTETEVKVEKRVRLKSKSNVTNIMNSNSPLYTKNVYNEYSNNPQTITTPDSPNFTLVGDKRSCTIDTVGFNKRIVQSITPKSSSP